MHCSIPGANIRVSLPRPADPLLVLSKQNMILRWSLGLSIGLFALGVVSIFGPGSSVGPGTWLAWCDLVGAWAAYLIAADITATSTRAQRIGGPIALSLGLFLACFVTYEPEEMGWLTWSTMAFACSFLLLGITRWIRKEVAQTDTSKEMRKNGGCSP